MSRARREIVLALVVAGGVFRGALQAAEPPSSRSEVHLWSIGAVEQWGPGGSTYYGTRVLRVTYCDDDDSCHTPITWFWGGEALAAPEGRALRAIGSFSIFAFPFGPDFETMHGRHRASLWLRPEVGIDGLWDAPDPGVGVSVGLGAELIYRPTPRTQLSLGADRYFSTLLGTRNQVSVTMRWGIHEKTHYP